MISDIFHFTSHYNYISFRRRQKLREEKPAKQMPGVHQNICPFCQCGWLFPGREALVNDDDNGSVDMDDDRDTDSERGNLEN